MNDSTLLDYYNTFTSGQRLDEAKRLIVERQKLNPGSEMSNDDANRVDELSESIHACIACFPESVQTLILLNHL